MSRSFRSWTLLAGIALGVSPSQAQTLSFHGQILDATGSAVGGVAVSAGLLASAQSNAAGEFSLDLSPGTYLLRLSAAGYLPSSETIAVAPGAANRQIFVLDFVGFAERIEVEAADPYQVPVTRSATRTETRLLDVPQSVSVTSAALIADQRMQGMADVVRYMPGVGMAQGEGNRDTPVVRGQSSTGDFFVDGVRDDLQYFRDTYNLERVEALKGPSGMIFGRGGTGGVINRVTRQAEWSSLREVALQLGSWQDRRITADLGQGLNERLAARVNALYENSDSFRDGVGAERYGANPTLAMQLGPSTTLRASYELFRDERTADRGVSSFSGRPLETGAARFFGDPERSRARAEVDLAAVALEHAFTGNLELRGRWSYGDYDKFYQNVFPGAVDETGTRVALQAYNNATRRRNAFQQTDLVLTTHGRVGHTVLLGVELGRQETDNFRNTGYFTSLGPDVTSVLVPVASPTTSLPIEFRQSATDADSHGVARLAAIYAQDQISLSSRLRAVIGLRADRFAVDLDNHRSTTRFSSEDDLWSPRVGLIFKPASSLSLYGSYGLSYQPRAGDQLASLSLSNQALDPEQFRSSELGAKWDLKPGLNVTAAVYRLERGNVAVPDPVQPSRSVLVDAQRTDGFELGVTGRLTRAWTVTGGYALQKGEITRSISQTAQAGASPAHLPRHSVSLWNRWDIDARWGAGLGVVYRGAAFASTDNRVALPGYTRLDAALYCNLSAAWRLQLNVENVGDVDYFVSANNNTNITPGSPRSFRAAVTARF
jgi:catecholate siderophore receptor